MSHPTFSYSSRIRIGKLHEEYEPFLDKVITVCGWARTVRENKGFTFVELYDGSSIKTLQVRYEAVTRGLGHCGSVHTGVRGDREDQHRGQL